MSATSGAAARPGHIRREVVMAISAAGRGRSALVAGTTALVSGLLLAAASLLRLPDPYAVADGHQVHPAPEPVMGSEAMIVILLMQLPLLLLLDQAVRLGSTGRRRRFAALAVAGATPRDLRRWSMAEVGAAASLGGLLGLPVWWVLRQLLGHALLAHGHPALVPTQTGPGLSGVLVIGLVSGYGLLVGARAAHMGSSPLERAHGLRRPPRPWLGGVALLLGLYLVAQPNHPSLGALLSDVLMLGGLALLPTGVAALSPWLAYVSAMAIAQRTRTVPTLLAARRLTADARPAGRAAAALGGVSLVVGVDTVYIYDALTRTDRWIADSRSYYADPAWVVLGGAVLALLVVGVSLATHTVETVLERRREMAALAATGIPVRTLVVSQRTECLIATVPLTVLGGFLGGFGYGWVIQVDARAFVLLAVTVTVVLLVLAIWITTGLLRRWVIEAVAAGELRTE